MNKRESNCLHKTSSRSFVRSVPLLPASLASCLPGFLIQKDDSRKKTDRNREMLLDQALISPARSA